MLILDYPVDEKVYEIEKKLSNARIGAKYYSHLVWRFFSYTPVSACLRHTLYTLHSLLLLNFPFQVLWRLSKSACISLVCLTGIASSSASVIVFIIATERLFLSSHFGSGLVFLLLLFCSNLTLLLYYFIPWTVYVKFLRFCRHIRWQVIGPAL